MWPQAEGSQEFPPCLQLCLIHRAPGGELVSFWHFELCFILKRDLMEPRQALNLVYNRDDKDGLELLILLRPSLEC